MKDTGPTPNVTPEEQAQYDTVVVAGLSFLYNDTGGAKAAVQKLKSEVEGGGTLARAIGHTVAMILISVNRAVKKKGGEVPKDVMFAAGQEVLAALIELAEEAGLTKGEDPDKLLKNSAFEAVQFYGNSMLQTGELTDQDRAEAQAEVQQIKKQQPAAPQPEKPGIVAKEMANG